MDRKNERSKIVVGKKWWEENSPKFKYKTPRKPRTVKSEDEKIHDEIVKEDISRREETELWAEYLNGRTFS